MSSPFSLFRKHQRVLMVVATGLAMISFVLLGMANSAQNLPQPLVILFLVAVFGGVAALAGMRSGNATEWGTTGALVAAIVLIAASYLNKPPAAVYISNGNISPEKLSELRHQRAMANTFIDMAFYRTRDMSLLNNSTIGPLIADMYERERMSLRFGFSGGGEPSAQDIVFTELLRRKGKEMGIAISDKAVLDVMKRAAGGKLTAEMFTQIRQDLRMSELQIMNAFKEEMLPRQVASMLYGMNQVTPVSMWDFHKQMNVSQTAYVAAIPVEPFIDAGNVPPVAELEAFFAEHRNNFPGFTVEGKPAPGRPGFVQPRRVSLGYFEASRESLETAIEAVTDEQVQQLYKERYEREMPGLTPPANSGATGDDIPPPTGDAPPAEAPGGELPAPPANEPVPPAAENQNAPAAPAPEQMPAGEQPAPAGNAPPADDVPPVNNNAPPVEQIPPAGDTPPAGGAAPPAGEAPPPGNSSLWPSGERSAIQPVAYLQDAAPAENPAPAPGENPAPAPNAEQAPPADGAAANDAAPVVNPPAGENAPPAVPPAPATPEEIPPPTGDAPQPGDASSLPELLLPPAPADDKPKFDDVKEILREELVNTRILDEARKRIAGAFQQMSDLSYNVLLPADDPAHVSAEDARKKLEEYAAAHQLQYVVTPMVTLEALNKGDEYPIGLSLVRPSQPVYTVVEAIAMTLPTDLYRPSQSERITGLENSVYAWWKVADKAVYAPENMSDPEIKEQVVKAWQMNKAEPLAKARAEELATKAKGEQPLPELLVDATVTGKAGDAFVEVQKTDPFTWMQIPLAPATSFDAPPPVRPSLIPGVPDAGQEFYEMACGQLGVGEVGIAPNEDHSKFYLIKIIERTPSTEDQRHELRNRFITQGYSNNLRQLGQELLAENSVNTVEDLFAKYDVVITPEAQQQQQ